MRLRRIFIAVFVIVMGKRYSNKFETILLLQYLKLAPEILHAGSCPGSSYIFQVS